MSEPTSYVMGYEDGYTQAVSGSDDPAPVRASYFGTLDEWDQYLEGFYTGQNDAYQTMAEEAQYDAELRDYYR
jgi:hypothetical protein